MGSREESAEDRQGVETQGGQYGQSSYSYDMRPKVSEFYNPDTVWQWWNHG